MECDSHGNPMGMGIAMWLIRGMGIKQRKRFVYQRLYTKLPAISTEQIHARTTTELCRPAMQTLLQIGDEGLAVPDNRGSER